MYLKKEYKLDLHLRNQDWLSTLTNSGALEREQVVIGQAVANFCCIDRGDENSTPAPAISEQEAKEIMDKFPIVSFDRRSLRWEYSDHGLRLKA